MCCYDIKCVDGVLAGVSEGEGVPEDVLLGCVARACLWYA